MLIIVVHVDVVTRVVESGLKELLPGGAGAVPQVVVEAGVHGLELLSRGVVLKPLVEQRPKLTHTPVNLAGYHGIGVGVPTRGNGGYGFKLPTAGLTR